MDPKQVLVLHIVYCTIANKSRIIYPQRLSAADALNSKWFLESPFPCSEERMPIFKSRFNDEADENVDSSSITIEES
jgi:hypothetical protein